MSEAAQAKRLPNSPVVVISYDDLIQERDISASIREAFGYDGLGLITVSDVPGFAKARMDLLPLAFKFANLPQEVKEKYEHPKSAYSFGWSHGKESYNGQPDFAKGSYYNNPAYDNPLDSEELRKEFNNIAYPNIWPGEDLPELETAFKDCGKLVMSVGELLSRECDKFIATAAPSYEKGKFERILKTSKCAKARLLNYFPTDRAINVDENNPNEWGTWCGWHNDHGSLTGLVPAIYYNEKGEEVSNPDPKSGLYIKTRVGETVKASWPTTHLAFQIGESQQVLSGGVLQATPHCVRAASGDNTKGISRCTFAVFMQPMVDEEMSVPEGKDPSDACVGSSPQFLPPGVPPLETRWSNKVEYGKYAKQTVEMYTIYE